MYMILHSAGPQLHTKWLLEEIDVPRKSPYHISLSNEERIALERKAAQYTAPYRDVVRAKIILLAATGLQNKDIAHRLSLPAQIVTKWRKRFYAERLAGLREKPRRQVRSSNVNRP